MPQSTDLNTPPYFEDFDPDKNFHRVLFRPGYPLQARDLTQSQSIYLTRSDREVWKEYLQRRRSGSSWSSWF